MRHNLLISLILLLFCKPPFVFSQQVIQNKTFTKGYELIDKKDVVIRNCSFANQNGKYGLKIRNCENIRIENCKISGIGNESSSKYFQNTLLPTDSLDYAVLKGNFDAVGLYLMNSKSIAVINCEILDVFGQGIKVNGDDCEKVTGIVIDSCRLAYIYDDGIKVEVCNDQSDFTNVLPMKGVVIKNNVIHDIGLGVTQLMYARHGMYVKSRDALIEGNTIYNCFYGEGISLRNAGIVRNNKVWNCYIGCIGFWAQTNTEGSSKTVVIENNICRQDYNLDLKMRHIYFPANEPVQKYNIIQWAFYDLSRSVASIDKFIIRNNTLIAGPDYRTSQAMMVSFEQPKKSQSLVFEGNEMKDKSGKNLYFVNMPRLENEAKK